MDCYFRQGTTFFRLDNILNVCVFLEWKDERLAFDAPFEEISLSMKMLELIWKPGKIKFKTLLTNIKNFKKIIFRHLFSKW
jgi:hypothetical protein